MKFQFLPSSLLLASVMTFSSANAEHPHDGNHHHPRHTHVAHQPDLLAVLSPTAGNDTSGWVRFEGQEDGSVKVSWEVSGLEADSSHAFHVHEFGDLSAEDGTATGGHFNPHGHDHGLPEQEHRHVGDLGNLETNTEGIAIGERRVDNLTLTRGRSAVLGRGLIVHANADDGGQPTGNAGARIAQGVIGIAKMNEAETSDLSTPVGEGQAEVEALEEQLDATEGRTAEAETVEDSLKAEAEVEVEALEGQEQTDQAEAVEEPTVIETEHTTTTVTN